jgi:1-acyl-sn-glycerol-3-phosphate acyltransferase
MGKPLNMLILSNLNTFPSHWLFGFLIVPLLGLALFIFLLPWIVQPFFRLILSVRYDLDRVGLENLPKAGPALVASNHLSWFDGFFMAAALPRRGTALVNAGVFRLPMVGFLARRSGLISVPFSGPRAQRAAIEAARGALDSGKILVIFPEAQLSRNGLTGPFYRGLEVILSGRNDIPAIPVYLDNVWGSLWSFSGGCFVRKWPQGWRRRVTIAFGRPIQPPATAFAVRQGVIEAGVRAVEARRVPIPPLTTIDPTLPHFAHPRLGLLTASTADYDVAGIRQVGHKPGTVGHPLPGVAIRAVDETNAPLPPDVDGRLQVLVPGLADWIELDRVGHVDRDGFVTLNG